MPKSTIPEKLLKSTTNYRTSRFEIPVPEAQVYETERNLIHEALPKEEERPSSSAWQSEGFVNLRSH